MSRPLPFSLAAFSGLLLLAATASAQETWPEVPESALTRGPGFYLAIYKLLLTLPLVWLWVKSSDFIYEDTREYGKQIGMPAEIWNPVVILPFLLGFIALLLIPIFFAGWAVLILTYAVPLGIYVAMRNNRVTEDSRIFTPNHFKRLLANLGKKKNAADAGAIQQPWELGPKVELVPTGKLQSQNQQNLIEARQSTGFVPCKFLLSEALESRADKVMLDFTADAVAVRYQIDGVFQPANPKVHEKDPLNRALGDAILLVLKKVAGLNPADRRSKQEGKLKLEYSGAKYDAVLVTQGVATGERVILSTQMIVKTPRNLEELGMREKLREQLKETLAVGNTGLIVFASMPGDGLTATWVASLRATDRLMRDFVSIEDPTRLEPDIENVNLTKVKTEEGETYEQAVAKVILKQPEVVCLPNVASGEALSDACELAINENKLAIVSTRGKDAADVLLRLLALKPEREPFVKALRLVVNQRLVRKLCEACREAIPAAPELCQRLGIPPGRIQFFYRERQPLTPEQEAQLKKQGQPLVCPQCRGLGYKGRTAIYEFLVIDDKIRQVLLQQPKVELIKQVAKQGGQRGLQEEGIALIALGVTSITEVQRVLKA